MKSVNHKILATLLLLSVLVGCSSNPFTGKRELIIISTQQEVALGAEAAPQFEQEFGGRVPDEALQSYVSGVGSKLAAVSDRQEIQYEFALLASDIPNAFALPGGKVYITAGLMNRMTNERQLAAVLGHEVTHVAALHNVKGLQRQLGAGLLVQLAGWAAGEDKQKAAEAAAKIVAGMANLKYSRDDEYQADRGGIKYLAEAGYNPWGMVELLEVLQAMSQSEPGSLSEMFQTHPLTSKRIDQARKEVLKKHEDAERSAPDPEAGRFLRMRAELPKYLKSREQ